MTRNQRQIIRRIIVRGLLVLESPTCFSNGDTDSNTDIALVKDSVSQRALLTGASIAGALRNYLHEYESGYGSNEKKSALATSLFGAIRQDDDGDQSPLIVYDAPSTKPPIVELRDGVKINSATRTAEEQAKYDLELLAAGTQFPLQFELVIDTSIVKTQAAVERLVKALAIALHGLENGDISLGMKKRRGFGRCKVEQWQVQDFDLTNIQQLRDWLSHEHWTPGFLGIPPQTQTSIKNALNIDWAGISDNRERLTIEATFELSSPILIRAGELEAKVAPDTVHLKSYRHGEPVPIISGSSLAGVLRHRAERIVNTIGNTIEKPPALINQIFGFVDEQETQANSSGTSENKASASRLIVHECEIKMPTDSEKKAKPTELVQTRIAIDRFTGGAYSGALFQEQPIFHSGNPQATIELELRNPKHHEIGLLLLLIKDLWTEDLPVGGTSSIGRGRLKGKNAKVCWQNSEPKGWEIEQRSQNLKVKNLFNPEEAEETVRKSLEDYVQALNNYSKPEANIDVKEDRDSE
ncbi:MAG: RAMP superfamily CRISPR-associated protein [Cyanobacteria bacterium P01_H01_bin.21]